MEEKTWDVIFIKSIVCKAVSMDHTKAIDTEAPYPLLLCVCVVCFLFLLVKNFGRLDTPPPVTKMSGSAPVRDFSLAIKI